MLPLVFLGGALFGAAGLAAAALYDNHRTESRYSPLLKTPEALDADGVVKELNAYFFKAQSLYMDCNSIIFDSVDLISSSVTLPWDGKVRKTLDKIGDGMNALARRNVNSRLRHMKEEAGKLYDRYRGVFARANELVRGTGRSPLNLDGIRFEAISWEVNNSADNEDWDEEIEVLADCIRNFLKKSCDAADRLTDMLQDDGKQPALEQPRRGE